MLEQNVKALVEIIFIRDWINLILVFISGQQIRGKVIATTLGSVQSLSFSPSNHVIAACVGREVYILDASVRT